MYNDIIALEREEAEREKRIKLVHKVNRLETRIEMLERTIRELKERLNDKHEKIIF